MPFIVHLPRQVLLGVAAFVLLFATSNAGATPPCPAFDYRVEFREPTCSAMLLHDSISLATLFVRNASSGNYTSLADLVRPAPSPAEPVTFLDANADGRASSSDAFQVWTPGGCADRGLTIYMGSNASSIGGSQTIFLREGFVQNCMGSGADSAFPWVLVILGAAGAAAVGLAAWILSRRHPSPPDAGRADA